MSKTALSFVEVRNLLLQHDIRLNEDRDYLAGQFLPVKGSSFLDEFGTHEMYNRQSVFSWLGY